MPASCHLFVGRPAQAGGQPLCPVGGEDHQGGWLDGSQAPQSRQFLEAEFDPAVFSEFDFRLRLGSLIGLYLLNR